MEVLLSGPLEGVKVLDLTAMISGPTATMILADQGAQVIKIENPKFGDYTRIVSTNRNGFSAAFLNNNRNKYSVAINLKDKDGVDLLKKMVKDSDVFIQNFRPEVADRMGLGEKVLRAINPSLIYVSICGFGFSGPYAQKPVYDPLVQALSGLTTVQAGSDEERPRLVRTILPDKLTGYATAQAICASLFQKLKSGKGDHIRVSMLDTVLAFLWGSDMGGHTFVGDEYEKETAQSFIDLIYETADGFISVAVQSDKEWEALCNAFGKKELINDERFFTAELRHRNIDDRLRLTQETLKEKKSVEWLEILTKYDVPCAPVLTRKEAIRHPQVVNNKSIIEINHSEAGRIRQCVPAPRFSQFPVSFMRDAPPLGGDTDKILLQFGLSEEEINSLIQKKVLAAPKISSEENV